MQESYLADCRFKKVEWKDLNLKRGQFFPYVAEGDGFEGQRCGGNNCVGRENELRGAVADIYQAADLAKLMGIVIK